MRDVGLSKFIPDWNLQIFLSRCHNPSNFAGLAKSSQSPHLGRPWGSRRIRNYGRLTFYCSVDVRATLPLLPPSDQIHATVRSDQIRSELDQINATGLVFLEKQKIRAVGGIGIGKGCVGSCLRSFPWKSHQTKIRGMKNKKLDYLQKKSWHLANLGNWSPMMFEF